ncbi:MAG: bifunctional riboflavin kinase/FAD synthetase [Micropruina glycogenica]
MSETVVVIGNFDGVHPGHVEVLAEAHARRPDLPLVVVTFWPHPISVLRPALGPMLLTGLDQRIELLQQAGADRVEVIHFTPEFATHTPAEFVDEVLLPLHPALIVVGENFRFGHRAAGNVQTLRELGQGRFEVEGLRLVRFGDEETCSTVIRQALAEGDVAHAAKHLGRPFRFSGLVAHGDHRGRELGFPTANLPVPQLLACPADGVYAGWLTRLDGRGAHGEPLPSGPNGALARGGFGGTNPTFDGLERRVESYVLGRTDLELYGAPIAVDFVDRIRGQVRFEGIDSLIVQMRDDVRRCHEILGS